MITSFVDIGGGMGHRQFDKPDNTGPLNDDLEFLLPAIDSKTPANLRAI